ncbi:MAG TPA: hypothetical protein VFT82_00385 [Candidatus Paceibacterota bacterium]|nr:hypothetical protein [Candidatus Paceibacterota bacterium]
MNCPICKKEMEVARRDKSNNPKDNKVYDRVVHRCPTCDAWVTVETPKK